MVGAAVYGEPVIVAYLTPGCNRISPDVWVGLLPGTKGCDIQSPVSQDAIIGCVVLAASLGVIVALVIWARGTIESIARNGKATSAREIMREMRRGR